MFVISLITMYVKVSDMDILQRHLSIMNNTHESNLTSIWAILKASSLMHFQVI